MAAFNEVIMDDPWYYFDLAPRLGEGFYIIDLGLNEVVKQGADAPLIVKNQTEAESWLEKNNIRGSIRFIRASRVNSWGEPVGKREMCAWLDGFESGWYSIGQAENPWNTTTGIRPHRAWQDGYLAGVNAAP